MKVTSRGRKFFTVLYRTKDGFRLLGKYAIGPHDQITLAKMPARPTFIAKECDASSAATLCHVSGDINLPNCLVRSIIFVHTKESRPTMRLRTLIELLAALILTFAALVAISKMAGATGIKAGIDPPYSDARREALAD